MSNNDKDYPRDRLAELHGLIGRWQYRLAPGRESVMEQINSLRKVCEEIEYQIVNSPAEAGEGE